MIIITNTMMIIIIIIIIMSFLGVSGAVRTPPKLCSSNLRYLPLFQQLLIILNSDVKVENIMEIRVFEKSNMKLK